jgi:hypothetical protein
MVDEAFYVHCHFARQQELLLVELSGHFFLERLVKELSENDNKRKYEQKRQDDYRGGYKFFLFEDVNDTLNHELIYIEKLGKSSS